jgi:alkylated DNA repair protein alkB family protein 8
MNQKTVNNILIETAQGYDNISEKFSQTRKHFWRGLEFIADYVQKGDKILDFGCGNGRLLELIGSTENVEYCGIDVSQKLLEIAQKSHPEYIFQKNDPSQATLPFASDFFNSIYSIAVFHHFPGKKYRQDLANELYRLTKKDGYLIVTVWNLWPASTRGNDRSSTRGVKKKYIGNILKNWFLKSIGKSRLDWNDCYISFTNNEGKKFERFHHAFTKCELKKLFAAAGFSVEQCKVIDGRNILLIAKK